MVGCLRLARGGLGLLCRLLGDDGAFVQLTKTFQVTPRLFDGNPAAGEGRVRLLQSTINDVFCKLIGALC